MLNLTFLQKILGLASSLLPVCDFSRRIFLMLYSINLDLGGGKITPHPSVGFLLITRKR